MLTLWLDLGDTKDTKKYVECHLGCIERCGGNPALHLFTFE